jgi:prophage antirepressor-like protein
VPELQPFVFPDTQQQIRTVLIDSVPWFVAADACAAIGISKYRDAVAQLDPDERASAAVDTLGGPQQMVIVNEAGLYALMLISRSEKVKPFRRWITHDVLPALRANGRYDLGPRHQLPQTYAEALRELATTVEQRDAAVAKVAELEPPAAAWNVLASAEGDWSVREAAYILNRDPGIDTGQNRLFEQLRTLGMVDRYDRPYATHARHLTLRPRSFTNRATGEETPAKPQVRITADGLAYLHRKLGGRAPLRLEQQLTIT